ncbi:hypothetical protein OHT52_07345 [Streptomyces sp. NBC_00247]|uniref:DUF7701 domain-containing protein n=1 Tax=Streptomyces sp. NBC_00247 TaxID=2975689 RepID=UPI002E27D247|nr:hypothetical protein [Streptomyces sp. NBC_00247]
MTYLDSLAALIRSCLPPEAEPPEDSNGLFRLYAVLLKAKGVRVTDEDVHDAWSAWMQTVNGTHESLVPFDDLDPRIRAYDAPYAEAIRAAARRYLT